MIYVAIAVVVIALSVAGGALYALFAERAANRMASEALKAQFASMLDASEARFREISERLLDERARKFDQLGSSGISRIMEPFAKDLAAFRKRVDEINSEGSERLGALKERIDGLVHETNAVSKEANNLASAIRSDVRVTGEWGEIQLKKVLEMGGLQENTDYTYQETFASSGSARKDLRTDVIVKMPGGRWLVIDAKTTLESYIGYVAAEDGADREEMRKRIVESVKNHVDELKRAEYQKNVAGEGQKALETVLMYIPFEEVYLMAMKADVTVNGKKMPLRDYALKCDVVMVNSSSLMPIVRLVAALWARDNADAKARKITEAAEGLIKKFNGFLAEFEGARAYLDKAVKAYEVANERLSTGKGNVMKRLSDLKSMGVVSAQSIKVADSDGE
ncbi:MAG: DNA recombination protein RmuC [Kiritimatiellae bacterium]|nr:DNA recombination protein RmuC [Kiritimatiellia bacterium]